MAPLTDPPETRSVSVPPPPVSVPVTVPPVTSIVSLPPPPVSAPVTVPPVTSMVSLPPPRSTTDATLPPATASLSAPPANPILPEVVAPLFTVTVALAWKVTVIALAPVTAAPLLSVMFTGRKSLVGVVLRPPTTTVALMPAWAALVELVDTDPETVTFVSASAPC